MLPPLFCVKFMDNFVCKFDTFILTIIQYLFVNINKKLTQNNILNLQISMKS